MSSPPAMCFLVSLSLSSLSIPPTLFTEQRGPSLPAPPPPTTTTTTTALLRALLWLWASMSALGADIVRIMSVDEFIQFKDNVNSGTSYSGTTVFLDSDLSLAGKTFELIGYSESNYFRGAFDGQGHVISNLTMTSSSQYVGLFGYSGGLTIKKVILDSSCSITSTFSGSSDAYIGGNHWRL